MGETRLPRLFINRIASLDWLIALEFGMVDDAQPPDNWRGVSEEFGYLCERPGGREVGFKVLELSSFEPNAEDVAEIWEGPRFDVPLLGLPSATAGEIVIGSLALLGDQSTTNRHYFEAATGAEGDEALGLWLGCLSAGDSMAHFGLGYTLFDLGRHHEAYRHLRHYTEIAPCHSWNWCWLAKAAEAIGESAEARTACERALELTAGGDVETEADEILRRLGD